VHLYKTTKTQVHFNLHQTTATDKQMHFSTNVCETNTFISINKINTFMCNQVLPTRPIYKNIKKIQQSNTQSNNTTTFAAALRSEIHCKRLIHQTLL